MEKIKVLMVGPDLSVKGGMTTVVNGYYECGLDKLVDMRFIGTTNDKNMVSKAFKMLKGFMSFLFSVKKYEIVHIHMASEFSVFRKGLYIRISKKRGKKVILHLHGAEYDHFYNVECNEKRKKYFRRNLELADRIIVLSEEWKNYFKSFVDGKKITVLHNAIKLPPDFEKNTDTKRLLFLGRIGDRKGVFDLIEVVGRLVKDYPELHLCVGGDGEVEKLKTVIREKNLENYVEYIGWTGGEKKDKYLREASYYILPSYNEGMPMSVLEGMGYKNITISTDVGGIPQVIQNGENGVIIKPGDTDRLEVELRGLFEDPVLRGKLSSNARKTIEEKFDLDKNVKKVAEIYETELSGYEEN